MRNSQWRQRSFNYAMWCETMAEATNAHKRDNNILPAVVPFNKINLAISISKYSPETWEVADCCLACWQQLIKWWLSVCLCACLFVCEFIFCGCHYWMLWICDFRSRKIGQTLSHISNGNRAKTKFPRHKNTRIIMKSSNIIIENFQLRIFCWAVSFFMAPAKFSAKTE